MSRPAARSSGYALAAFFAFVSLVSSTGCKPTAGSRCAKEGKEICQDNTQALVCHEGTWELMACRGATGCVGAGDSASCDNMTAEENDVCNLDGDFACTTDKKACLSCAKKKWTIAGACRGPNGCQVNAKHIKCDASIGREGEPCMKEDEGDHTCSEDKKSSLVCRGGKLALAAKCAGPNGCRFTNQDEIECDDSVSDVGDPCDLADHFSCSKDGKALLVCKAGKFAREEDCKKKTCRVQGDKAGCL